MKILHDEERCTGCGLCARVCPQMILEVEGEAVRVRDESRCMGCFGCEDECPAGAIRILRGPAGEPIQPEPPLDVSACDVVVVGAGPGGLGAAIACARRGLDVVVCERLPHRRISHHPDGGVLFGVPGIVSVEVDRRKIVFPELEIELPGNFARRCEEFGLMGPEGIDTQNDFPPGCEGWVGRKDRLCEALANEAEKAGAKLWFNARVEDVLREGGRVTGVRLHGGQEIRASVTVTADGVRASTSEKAGMDVATSDLWYASVIALEYENAADLPCRMLYLNGGMQFEETMPPVFGALATTDVVHVVIALYSQRKSYPGRRPIQQYAARLQEEDPRARRVLGDSLDGARPDFLNGCRVVFRPRCNTETVGEGVVSVGDAWVDDGEIGNVTALANGVHAGDAIADALARGKTSKDALAPANDFIRPDLVRMLEKNREMKLLATELDEEETRIMFRFMQHMNYPLMIFGSPARRGWMFTKFVLKNLHRFVMHPGVAKKIM